MAEKNTERNRLRKEKVQAERLELYVADYVKHKYKSIYNEAIQYFSMLRQQNPVKLNLKKTQQYRDWVKQQGDHGAHNEQLQQVPEYGFYDNLRLKITLMDGDNIKEKSENPASETLEEKSKNPASETLEEKSKNPASETLEMLVEECIGEGNIQPSLEEVLPFDLIDEIMEELKRDPELENIFEELDICMDIEIDDDIRLEKELL